MAKRLLTVLLLALVACLVIACTSPADIDYIPEGGSYAEEELETALAQSDAGATADVTTEEAPEVRQEALARLRQHGADAASLADTLTSEFPVDVAAVPYAVELGEFEGQPAYIVFEAWGEDGGTLSYRRMWVFSRDDMGVLAARSVR